MHRQWRKQQAHLDIGSWLDDGLLKLLLLHLLHALNADDAMQIQLDFDLQELEHLTTAAEDDAHVRMPSCFTDLARLYHERHRRLAV